MSAPIHALLAKKLGISGEKAQKLLTAMLREVRARAQKEGVRLPELGKFSERGGQLVFEPSDSLAQAVNHRFEGLDSEDLASAPDNSPDNEQNQGPSTITLGYQNSSWSPLDSEETSETAGENASEESEPDTAEFEVPSADDAADTEELQTVDASQERDPASRSASQDTAYDKSSSPSGAPSSDTEELYPLVEDSSEGGSDPTSSSESTQSERDMERETLSGIWNSDDDDTEEEDETSTADPPSWAETEDSSSSESFDWGDDDSSEPEEPVYGEHDIVDEEREPPVTEQKTTRAPKPAEAQGSSASRVLVTLLVLLLLGGGTWYVLGQQGLVPPPRTTYAQVQSQLQPHLQNVPFIGPAASEETTSSTGPSGEETDGAGSSTPPTNGDTPTQASDEAASASADGAPSESTSEQTSGSAELDPSSGGWTIVVASRAEEAAASSLTDTYRSRFDAQEVPIGIIAGNVDNATRYRVGIGQFDSRSEAQGFLEESGSELPDGAWILNLE